MHRRVAQDLRQLRGKSAISTLRWAITIHPRRNLTIRMEVVCHPTQELRGCIITSLINWRKTTFKFHIVHRKREIRTVQSHTTIMINSISMILVVMSTISTTQQTWES